MVVENAIKYACCSSVVEMEFERVDNRIQIAIINEGEAIPEAYHESIFGEFFVHNMSNHHYGNGLSLAIAKRIAENHDGTLTVRNLDRGPSFIFDLPA